LEEAYVIIVHKLKGLGYVDAIRNVYRVLGGERVQEVEVVNIDQDWFKENVSSGWNIDILVKGAYSIVKKLISIDGYRVSDLFKDLQGVTTGSNRLFVFDHSRWAELESIYKLSMSGLVYDCIAGEDIKPWSISIRRKILFPYKIGVGGITGKHIWIPAFMMENGDVLDFTKRLVNDEKLDESIHDRLDKRIAYGIIPQGLIGVAKYLVDHYEELRNRRYEGKAIEEYAGVWYGFHRPRTPEIIKVPNIVTPRVVKEPRFALNRYRAIPLDNVIVLIPKGKEDPVFKELWEELERIIGSKISIEDILLYILSILNSRISYFILKTRATRVRGGYYTIDERYLSSIIIPKLGISDREILKEIYKSIKTSRFAKIDHLITKLYSKHAGLDNDEVKCLLDMTI